MKLKIFSESKTLALFIPSVKYNLHCKFIAAKFAARKLGIVSRIEWVENNAYPKYKRCFVFLTPTKSKNAEAMLSALKDPKGYRLYYSSTEYWKVVVNKNRNAFAPPNIHMDIQITVPSGTDIDFVYAKLDAERIGKIAGYYLGSAYLNNPNTIIVFEYWYHNESAIALQQALLNTEFVDLTVALDMPTAILNPELQCTEVVWRVHQSIYPPILSGVSPYIWTNRKQA
jgi:hypothetical protein